MENYDKKIANLDEGLEIIVKNGKYGVLFFDEVIVPCIYDNYDLLREALSELMKNSMFMESLKQISNKHKDKKNTGDVVFRKVENLENSEKKLDEISKGHKVDIGKVYVAANQDDFVVGYAAPKFRK